MALFSGFHLECDCIIISEDIHEWWNNIPYYFSFCINVRLLLMRSWQKTILHYNLIGKDKIILSPKWSSLNCESLFLIIWSELMLYFIMNFIGDITNSILETWSMLKVCPGQSTQWSDKTSRSLCEYCSSCWCTHTEQHASNDGWPW